MKYAADGASYSWSGEVVGSGELAIVSKNPPKEIGAELTFLKPFKSVADVKFHFEGREKETEVTWMMNSSLPFFLFFLKNMMTTMIGMDYERGLAMLKATLETGTVPSSIAYQRARKFSPIKAIAPFEIYENDPTEVDENDLITVVHFPMK